MGYNNNDVKSIEEIMKEEYIKLLSQYTGIGKDKLLRFAAENPVRNIFEYPEALDLTKTQFDRLTGLRRWRQLFENIKEFEGKEVLRSPQDAYLICSDLAYENKEYFMLIILNTKNEMIKKTTISIGSLNSSLVHPREVFKEAIKYSAASVILAHNHPSGNTTPSDQDKKITQRLMEGGNILGIQVLDHIIVGKNGYTSMKEEHLIDDNNYCFEKFNNKTLHKENRDRY